MSLTIVNILYYKAVKTVSLLSPYHAPDIGLSALYALHAFNSYHNLTN